MPDRAQRLQEIFIAALGVSDPAARSELLATECGEDVAMRAELEGLLAANDAQPTFLRDLDGAAFRAEAAGEFIGHYQLVAELGEGGFGTVWKAEQHEPVRRFVALKIIKLGMDTREVIARFEQERQALALMEHPGIAKVLDAGTTASGRPFFVMELVGGVPITRFCDEQKLPVRERLALFVQVCAAIQHAHQKGIIHRDIKPSNILVARDDDGEPAAKVIDFGIAKATAGKLTDKTLFTEAEQMIGTPAYMSPEQAGLGGGQDIDTRCDIYALGVVLYELLTGRTPFDPRALLAAGFEEMRRIIREEEPPRPSTRLGTLAGADSTTIAASRSSELPKLITTIRRELDWVVMKAIEKDRARRYDTANGLARDIERFLRNEPVTARPPSRAYRASKFVRRHRLAVSAAAAIVLALGAGLAVSLWQWRNARDSLHQFIRSEIDENMMRGAYPRVLALVAEAERTGHPDRESFLFKRIEALEALGDPAGRQLIESLDPRTLSKGQQARLLYWKADKLSSAGEAEKAAVLFEEALAAGLPPVETSLVRAELASNLADAIRHYEDATAAEPWRHDAQSTLVFALALSGRVEEAKARIQLCRLYFPQDTQIPLLDIYIESLRGNTERARELFIALPDSVKNTPSAQFASDSIGPLSASVGEMIPALLGLAPASNASNADLIIRIAKMVQTNARLNNITSPFGVGLDLTAQLRGQSPLAFAGRARSHTLIQRFISGFVGIIENIGDPAGAIKEIESLLGICDEGYLWLSKATRELTLEQNDSALESCRKAQKTPSLVPGVADGARVLEALVQVRLYERDRDIAHYQTAVALLRESYRTGFLRNAGPQHHILAVNVGISLEDHIFARLALEHLPKNSPDYFDALVRLKYAEGDRNGALEIVDNAIKLHPAATKLPGLRQRIIDRQLTVRGQTAVNISMDGQSDTFGCQVIPGHTSLIFGIDDTRLFVGTWSKGNTDRAHDHIVFVSDELLATAEKNASWGKAGKKAIPENKPLLGGESTTNYVGWQGGRADPNATAFKARTDSFQLKGSMDAAHVFRALPGAIFISAVKYVTTHNGGITEQCPPGNGDDNIDPAEFIRIPFGALVEQRRASNPDFVLPKLAFALTQETPDTPITLVLSWAGTTDKRHELEFSDDSQNWQDLKGEGNGVSSARITFSAPMGRPRFFRIKAAPQTK
jgi:serine/threonine protein kinase